jgi:hypothetical protein
MPARHVLYLLEKIMSKRFVYAAALLALLLPSLRPQAALACACGCGVFDVGTGTMMPTDTGGTAWLEYDFMNQTQNWSGTSAAPGANNPDKIIRSNFFTAGVQYMFNRDWGIEAELPYTYRDFKTTTDYPATGDTQIFDHAALGDVRVQGIYSGFSDDMSTGITFGLKLATGDFTYPNFDRDTSIGTGSTNFLLGAYHMGDLSGLTGMPFNWFVNGQWDQAFTVQQNYRPGDEFDAALGSYYAGLDFGSSGKLSPLLQVLLSVREHDTGLNANQPINGVQQSGYQRLLISPGAEYDLNSMRFYGDVEVPFFQNVNGNQLVAPVLVKLMVAYNF